MPKHLLWLAAGALFVAADLAAAQAPKKQPTIEGEWQHILPAFASHRVSVRKKSLAWRILLSDHVFFQWRVDWGGGSLTATCQLVDQGQALLCRSTEFDQRYRRVQ